MWFGTFLRNRDAFGHPMHVMYKGQETYSSIIGGLCTLLKTVMTGVLVIMAILELVMMKEPKIIIFTKPLTRPERAELAPFHFNDYDYVLAVKATVTRGKTGPG